MAAESQATRPSTSIDVWFDPVCPFTWVTSRWLLAVAGERPVEIRWNLMSLAVLNEGNDLGPDEKQEMADSVVAGRLLSAVAREHGSDTLGRAYTSLGERVHRRSASLNHDVAVAALEECGVDTALAAALDDPRYDADVRRSHDEGQKALGDAGGSPIISIDGATFFGPVLMSIPRGDEALELFDAVTTIAGTDSFSQFQRPHGGRPEVE